ncbi:M48 family metalloprotease [Kitasatospora sp. YST-16]|uniref:M48 family metalloprotease n=1 Tax=Kitasatospora sp. YST-16 TaxID=2998080 RepID=UPI002283B1DB|nr:M48 family metalloprotease [Kitasatospora sp. YST-16]WAL72559.1 M48 family metalloprotease [Kitasatospora sp. YST-16]WNW38606.1 M48 family metalloprotease [Streptomyces sp. Li-HN-5-13]
MAQLVAALPIALISFFVVVVAGVLVNPVLGVVVPLLWLGSGLLVFRPSAERLIARRLGMRQPQPGEEERLAVVWDQVTRRAGVDPQKYQLWVQDRAELNSTATAGHIVGVTRLALDRLTNAQLAGILAHELGHHVGGHTWAGLLADWYTLPGRAVGRAAFRILSGLIRSKHPLGVGCGGCLMLMLPFTLVNLLYVQRLWWLLVPAALAPVFTTLLRRRAEQKADDYAVALGFGAELAAVVLQEQQRLRVEGPPYAHHPYPGWAGPGQPAAPTWGPGAPPPQYIPSPPYAPPPYGPPGGQPTPYAWAPSVPPSPRRPRTPHTDLEARLRRLSPYLGEEAPTGAAGSGTLASPPQ